MKLYNKNIEDGKSLAGTSALENLGVSTSDVCFAVARLALEDNPEMLLYRLSKGSQMIDPIDRKFMFINNSEPKIPKISAFRST